MGNSANRFLITGATGFIGSDVVARLLRAGQSPSSLYLLVRKRPDPQRSILARRLQLYFSAQKSFEFLGALRFIECDFSDRQGFRRALQTLATESANLTGAWVLLHLAAIISASGKAQALQKTINVDVTNDLIDWANLHAQHFIFASSIVAFGFQLFPKLRCESDFGGASFVSDHFAYFSTKREAHLRVQATAKIPHTIICPGVVHGPLEDEKSSRGHLRALEKGTLRFAPGGGGNIVSLAQVSKIFVAAALGALPTSGTILAVGVNVLYRDYFERYVKVKTGRKVKIWRLPLFVGHVVLVLTKLLALLKIPGSALLDSFAAGSLYGYFESQYKNDLQQIAAFDAPQGLDEILSER